ncbi:right-handed parallel beta-helix repeat-containing protein [Spirosoma sp. KUDC1026]|uniref:right-handed parallel beta-helix repeat-containing protein n=1 Tax=Spirosoma sp. KUDC1026 TaxID=2745947 RepID=UPI00159BB5DD|nr:right-handed parallel beta-helix repeat-containing protein [Spirosoma sp. KUDC1026]QKZ15311.1 right-handed parallel beta-helix repeat-containing protein [Spirosoma sp. KUDC1026]
MILAFIFLFISASPSVVDNTKTLQQLLNKNAGKTLTLPAGTFNVSTLNVSKQTKLTIGPKTILRGLPTTTALPVLQLQAGVTLTGTGVVDGNRKVRTKGMGVLASQANNLIINGLRIKEVAEQGIHVVKSKGVILRNMVVTGCGAKGIDQFQGIHLVISQNVQVANCRVENAQHGIQWWGDDTNGFCENIAIRNNIVRKVDGGGIWGYKGRKITVTTNNVAVCGDVGIDFENSFNSIAIGNVVRDCKNHGLATFFASENIKFVNNRVVQGAAYGNGIGLCAEGLSKNISFIGGSISTKGPDACGLATVGSGIVQDVLVQGMRIVTEGKNGVPIRVLENNRFRIINNPLLSGISPIGVSLEGSSGSEVSGNTIVHAGTDGSGLNERGGVFMYYRSAQFPSKNNRVTNNTIRGFKTGINDDCWGDVNSNNVIEQNVTPNVVHRQSNGTWGGKAQQNVTAARVAAPVQVKQ